MRLVRSAVFGLLVAIIAAALITPAPTVFAGQRSSKGAGSSPSRGGLDFEKPVALNSASPVRGVMSQSPLYGGSDHEWSGEPVIQVDPDGTIIIAGTCCIVASSPVWFSTDGKKFEEVETPAHAREWSIGAEGDLAIDDEGGIYFVDTYVTGLVLTKWNPHEGGPEWAYTAPANIGVPPGVNDRPWLAWSKKGLYLYINHVTHVTVYRSTDGGLTWTEGAPLSWDGSAIGQQFWPGHIAAERDTGTLYVSGPVGDGRTMGSAVSTDGGHTYRYTTIMKVPKGRSISPIFTGATAVDEAGTAYVTWSLSDDFKPGSKDPRGCDVYFASSSDKGKSWSDPVKVSRGPGCATFPWVTAGGPGKIALTWYQSPYQLPGETSGDAPQNELPPMAEWFVHAAAVTDATGKAPEVSETRVKTKTPIALGPLGRQLWDFLQVAIGPRGDIHITFADKFKDDAPQTWYVHSSESPRLR